MILLAKSSKALCVFGDLISSRLVLGSDRVASLSSATHFVTQFVTGVVQAKDGVADELSIEESTSSNRNELCVPLSDLF